MKQRFKGRRAGSIAARETNTSCATGFRTGRAALVFVGAERWAVGSHDGYLEQPSAELIAAMAAWAQAAPADRAAVLIAAITAADRRLATDAASYLADQPGLITALTADQVAALVAARGDRRTDEAIVDVIARHHGAAWQAVIAAGLPPRRPGLAALAAHDLEAITDVAVLADRIAQTPGERAAARIAALERCERIHGRALEPWTSYRNGRSEPWWLKLAQACRSGTPPS